MRAAIKTLKGITNVEDETGAPWIYNYFVQDFLDDCPNGLAMLKQILATEVQLIALKAIVALGFYVVIHK
jgi:hypothetical protein